MHNLLLFCVKNILFFDSKIDKARFILYKQIKLIVTIQINSLNLVNFFKENRYINIKELRVNKFMIELFMLKNGLSIFLLTNKSTIKPLNMSNKFYKLRNSNFYLR